MIRSARKPGSVWRHVYLTLAALAVALKVLIPPGFMVAAPSNDLPFAIVLCTAQGAVTVEAGQAIPGHDDRAPAKSAHDSPCAFAGFGAALTPPAAHDAMPVRFVAYQTPVSSTPLGLAPGRGLSGPPLPARGPPSLLI